MDMQKQKDIQNMIMAFRGGRMALEVIRGRQRTMTRQTRREAEFQQEVAVTEEAVCKCENESCRAGSYAIKELIKAGIIKVDKCLYCNLIESGVLGVDRK